MGQTVSLIGTWMTRIATSWRACCIAGAGWFLSKLPQIRAHIRPIYGRLGILPGIAQELQAAAVLQIPPED